MLAVVYETTMQRNIALAIEKHRCRYVRVLDTKKLRLN